MIDYIAFYKVVGTIFTILAIIILIIIFRDWRWK